MSLSLGPPQGPVLALGAHADDVEIGAGGLLFWMRSEFEHVDLRIAVFTGDDDRRAEAEASAIELSNDRAELSWLGATDGLLPIENPVEAKQFLREVASERPSIVLSPRRDDAHQDHRFVSELAWQVCRGAWIIEYGIPKWDPEPKETNLFLPLSDEIAESKLDHLERHFPSQHDKSWYRRELFDGILRTNGVACGADRAEAFIVRKIVLS